MQSRRHFIGNVATGLAGIGAGTGSLLGSNDRIRIGIVGYGDRGRELCAEASNCAGVEIAGFSDVYARRNEEAKARFPAAKTYTDAHQLLSDPTLDAVVIATPQHLHAEHFLSACDTGKHVYIEKTMAFTVEEAKQMRGALIRSEKRFGRRAVQIGHQGCSSGQVADAMRFLGTGQVGRITAIRGQMYRNTPHGKAQWSRPVYPDMTPEQIEWDRFLGQAPRSPFDPQRFVNWRYFWDYSGGNVHENLSQQLAFWYKTLGLQIPRAVTMTGGVYLWKDGREVPDTMNVSMEHSEELLFTWDSGFGNSQPGVSEEALGTDGSLSRGQQIRYFPQKVNRRDGVEALGQTVTAPRAHVQNFFDCIRSGKETNCPFDIGFRVSIACRMAIASYQERCTKYWDANSEVIA